MKSKILILSSLVLVLFLVLSCAPKQEETTTPSQTTEPTKTVEAGPEPEPTNTGQVEVIKTTPTKPTAHYAEEIQELLDKSEGITNYQYYYESLKKNTYGSDITYPSYDVYIKGNKIKKVYSDPIKINSEAFYNEVYMDTNEKTAYGICSQKSRLLCENSLGKIYTLKYYDEVLPLTPLELLEKMPYDIKKIGDRVFADRQVAVLQYDQGEGFVKLMVDKYYGLPVEYEIYTWDDDVEVLQERHTFSKPMVDKLKNADVNLPEGYEPAK